MRGILLISFVSIISSGFFAQSADKGAFKFNFGVGSGVLTTVSNADVTDVSSSSYALPSIGAFSFEYNTRERLSIGLEFFAHTYNSDDTAVVSIGGGAAGLDLKYFLINKEKSNVFIGTTLGAINIIYNAYNYPDSASADTVRKEVWLQANGIYNKVYIGYNKYFGNVFGLYIKAGLLNAPFRMGYITIDDVEVDRIDKMPTSEWNSLFRGGYFEIGVSLKFGNKSEKIEEVGDKEVKKDESKE